MKRNYVGIACTGHDGAIAIVNADGEIVFAEGSERYLQNKRALGYAAEDMIRTPQLIDEYCDPDAALLVARTWSDTAPDKLMRGRDCLSSVDDPELRWVLGWNADSCRKAGSFIQHRFQDMPLRNRERAVEVRGYEHHLSHAAAACYTSGFDEAVCAIIDGGGEESGHRFFRYERGVIRPLEGTKLGPERLSSTLGLFYAVLCDMCGFDPWQGEEWKVMGLAAYGKLDERLYALMQNVLAIDGLDVVDSPDREAAWASLLSSSRKPGAPALDAADFAFTGQRYFADCTTKLLANLRALGQSDNLVYGGGCALNSAFNGEILRRTGFKRLHVFSAPADDGNAVGAALLAFCDDHPGALVDARPMQSPFLGSELGTEQLDRVMRFAPAGKATAFPGEIHLKAAELLAAGKILGWAQGRAEFGPRALGNRSILANPRLRETKDRLNAVVKFREDFRPFAPSILAECADAYFVDYQPSPYMERTLRFRDEVKSKVPAVVHIDGTGRLQTVSRDWNPLYYDLISEFHRRTGVPLILNTSFNVMGKPIIHSVEDALGVFYSSGLDALIIGDILIQK